MFEQRTLHCQLRLLLHSVAEHRCSFPEPSGTVIAESERLVRLSTCVGLSRFSIDIKFFPSVNTLVCSEHAEIRMTKKRSRAGGGHVIGGRRSHLQAQHSGA
jgi:hypothetical protein